MTEPRPYRAGLGDTGAIVIRGDPGPSTRQRQLFEAAQADLAEQDWVPPTEGQIWNEWNINPARHGPERLTRLPTFVKSSSNYDELGRSAIEGVEVIVDQGTRNKGKGRASEVGHEDMGEWYKALAGKSRSNTRATTPVLATSDTIIDLTEEEDLFDDRIPGYADPTTSQSDRKPSVNVEETSSRSATDKDPPIRVHRSEWFIRRALLAQSRSSSSSAASSPGPASITTMLNIETKQPRVSQHRYVLGPDNKGYELLKTRHGWEGGGLGRPTDWEERMNDSAQNAVSDMLVTPEAHAVVELDANGEAVVDLTAESEPEPEDDYADVEPLREGGPGRTAPIATSLKLDRLGLGHQRNKRAARDAEKKVTHTIEEIRRVQQRSRYPPPKQGIELGKKGKIKWKERDKRERDERKRLLAVLNN